ncbi:MAG: NUDIX hydrolase [Alphaproteobacteria bacterium]|nr:MAG: NUDIX hydrolase [Alphaproteobacteria bacterium]
MSDPKHISRTELYANPWFRVAEHRFSVEGRELSYFVKEDPEFSVVGALTEDGQVLLLRQFRPGPGRFLYDLPAGMIEPGDTPLETARKELLEETGYAGDIEPLATTYVTAYSTARKHIFIARNCRRVAEPEDEDNIVAEPLLMSVADFSALVTREPMLDLDAALLFLRAIS